MPRTHLLPPRNLLEDHPPPGAGTASCSALNSAGRDGRGHSACSRRPESGATSSVLRQVPGRASYARVPLRSLDFSPSRPAAAQGLPTPPRTPAPINPCPHLAPCAWNPPRLPVSPGQGLGSSHPAHRGLPRPPTGRKGIPPAQGAFRPPRVIPTPSLRANTDPPRLSARGWAPTPHSWTPGTRWHAGPLGAQRTGPERDPPGRPPLAKVLATCELRLNTWTHSVLFRNSFMSYNSHSIQLALLNCTVQRFLVSSELCEHHR